MQMQIHEIMRKFNKVFCSLSIVISMGSLLTGVKYPQGVDCDSYLIAYTPGGIARIWTRLTGIDKTSQPILIEHFILLRMALYHMNILKPEQYGRHIQTIFSNAFLS